MEAGAVNYIAKGTAHMDKKNFRPFLQYATINVI
jgi:hypothetical protein